MHGLNPPPRAPRRTLGAALSLTLAFGAAQAVAAPRNPGAITVLSLDDGSGHSNPRPQGLSALLYEAKRRTSLAIDLTPERFPLAQGPAVHAPSLLMVWQGEGAFGPLPEAALRALGRFLDQGGMLLVDASEGLSEGPFEQSVRRELKRLYPGVPVEPVSPEHVLYKAFYLVDRHGGRVNARPSLLGLTLHGRLAVVLTANDLLGSLAKTPLGAYAYSAADGDRAREMALRLGVNWLMYSLCLDYKEDQVHLPFILKRRAS